MVYIVPMIQKIPTNSLFPYLDNFNDMPEYIYIRTKDETDKPNIDHNALNALNALKICIVGARKHTAYGVKVVEELIQKLAPYKPIIVSGLATGIDSIALETALKHNLQTIAVIGSGLDDDSIYPRENIPLVYQIQNQNGLIISEYPEGEQGLKWHFPARNRIMAGISDVIIIVEGTERSGTLITARLGLEFGKDIICVPGSIFSPLSTGPLGLISQGAIPLTEIDDIEKILNLESPNKGENQSDKSDNSDNKKSEKTAKQLKLLKDEPDKTKKYSRCNYDETYVLKVLKEPLSREELTEITQYSYGALQIILIELEIKGYVTEKYGKIVRV